MIIYGIHPVTEALKSLDGKVELVWLVPGKSNPRLQRIIKLAKNRNISLDFKSAAQMTQEFGNVSHQEVAAKLSSFQYSNVETIMKTNPRLLLLVDRIEDPQNLGALLRSAEGAGIGGVFISQRRSCAITPAVLKASAGAAMHLKISREVNAVRTLRSLKQRGFWALGLDMQGETSVNEIDPNCSWVVVVGGEHQGLRKLLREQCDFLVSLPMRGRVSSLNLSVAAGVVFYQLLLRCFPLKEMDTK